MPNLPTDTPTLKLVDLYHGDDTVQFHPFAAAGVVGCFLKASQGISEIDPRYSDFYTRAGSVGLLRGAYHFFTADDPVQQAKHFVNAAKLTTGDLAYALDVETAFGGQEGVGQSARDCALEIMRLTGVFPLIYASQSFYHEYLEAYFPSGTTNLWIARYGGEPDIDCAFWQYSESARLPGESQALDTDVFFGDMDDLKTYCIG